MQTKIKKRQPFITFFNFCKPKLFFQEVKNHTSKLTLRSEARASQKWTKILIKSFLPPVERCMEYYKNLRMAPRKFAKGIVPSSLPPLPKPITP